MTTGSNRGGERNRAGFFQFDGYTRRRERCRSRRFTRITRMKYAYAYAAYVAKIGLHLNTCEKSK